MVDSATQSYFARELSRIRDNSRPTGSVTARIIAAKRHLETHYSEAPDLDALSRRACLSKFHLIRQFRRLYGRTPCQILRSVRIRRARELLERGASVREASLAVGYDSVPSFSALFRRMTGMSPSAVRKKHNFR